MSRPLTISVVTPSYNQGRFLDKTIRSVLSQDYPHVEYLIIDGYSTDSSVEIIRSYEAQLAYWCSETDQGQADAIGKGFELSKGDILCWLNSDDVFLPGALSAVADYFTRHPEIDVVSGGGYYIDANGQPLTRGFGTCSFGVAATSDRFRSLQAQDGVLQQATFWRRRAYDEVGGIDRQLQFIMDLDLFTRLSQLKRFGRLPRLLACFRLHDGCKTRRWREVRRREGEQYAHRYGIDEYNWTVRHWKRWRHRLPSLLRKSYLRALRSCGIINLPSV